MLSLALSENFSFQPFICSSFNLSEPFLIMSYVAPILQAFAKPFPKPGWFSRNFHEDIAFSFKEFFPWWKFVIRAFSFEPFRDQLCWSVAFASPWSRFCDTLLKVFPFEEWAIFSRFTSFNGLLGWRLGNIFVRVRRELAVCEGLGACGRMDLTIRK